VASKTAQLQDLPKQIPNHMSAFTLWTITVRRIRVPRTSNDTIISVTENYHTEGWVGLECNDDGELFANELSKKCRTYPRTRSYTFHHNLVMPKEPPPPQKEQPAMKKLVARLNMTLDINDMKKRDMRSLDSVRYRTAEYWYCRGFIDAMPDNDEAKFLSEFLSMLQVSGRSILTLKPE
jgi:hypothetical protein